MPNSTQKSGFNNFASAYRLIKEVFPLEHEVNTLLDGVVSNIELLAKEKEESAIATLDATILRDIKALSDLCAQEANAKTIERACACNLDNSQVKALLIKPKVYLDSLKKVSGNLNHLKKFYEMFIKDALITYIKENPTKNLKKLLQDTAADQKKDINELMSPPATPSVKSSDLNLVTPHTAPEQQITEEKLISSPQSSQGKSVSASKIHSCYGEAHGDDGEEIKDDGSMRQLDPYDLADQQMIFGGLEMRLGPMGKNLASTLCQNYLARLDLIIENFNRNGILPVNVPTSIDVYFNQPNSNFLEGDGKKKLCYILELAANKAIPIQREAARRQSGALFLAPLQPAQKLALKKMFTQIYLQNAFKKAFANGFSENYASISATLAACGHFGLDSGKIFNLEALVKKIFSDNGVQKMLQRDYSDDWEILQQDGTDAYVHNNLSSLWHIVEKVEMLFPELITKLPPSLPSDHSTSSNNTKGTDKDPGDKDGASKDISSSFSSLSLSK